MRKQLSRAVVVPSIGGVAATMLTSCANVASGTVGHHDVAGAFDPTTGLVHGLAHTLVFNPTPATLTYDNELVDEAGINCAVPVLSCSLEVTVDSWAANFPPPGFNDEHLFAYISPFLHTEHTVKLHVASCAFSDGTPCISTINQDAEWGYSNA
jgi:hypothetical protein